MNMQNILVTVVVKAGTKYVCAKTQTKVIVWIAVVLIAASYCREIKLLHYVCLNDMFCN